MLGLPDDHIIIYIHLYDRDFYYILDRIILAICELKKQGKKIYTVVYWGLNINISKKITKSDFTIEGDKVFYKVYNNYLPVNVNDVSLENIEDTQEFNIEYYVSKIYSSTNKSDVIDLLNIYLPNEHRLMTNIDDGMMLSNIFASDIYIPVTENMSYLPMVSQLYQTYTILVSDNNNLQEYCIYGDNPLLKSDDYLYNVNSKKIKRNLRVQDIQSSIDEYIENKENPFFIYKKEFCSYIFG